MKIKASGTIQVFVTAEFEDDWGEDITAMAYAELHQEAMAQGIYGAEFVNIEFDRVEGGVKG